MQPSILGLVDHAHTAATEFLDDAVMRNGLADHWAEILGLEVGQVNEGEEVADVSERQLLLNHDFTH